MDPIYTEFTVYINYSFFIYLNKDTLIFIKFSLQLLFGKMNKYDIYFQWEYLSYISRIAAASPSIIFREIFRLTSDILKSTLSRVRPYRHN